MPSLSSSRAIHIEQKEEGEISSDAYGQTHSFFLFCTGHHSINCTAAGLSLTDKTKRDFFQRQLDSQLISLEDSIAKENKGVV